MRYNTIEYLTSATYLSHKKTELLEKSFTFFFPDFMFTTYIFFKSTKKYNTQHIIRSKDEKK